MCAPVLASTNLLLINVAVPIILLHNKNMTDKPHQTLLHIAAAYAFAVEYIEILDRWSIKGKSPHGAEFYWDTSYDERDFFNELASFWRVDGSESSYPY